MKLSFLRLPVYFTMTACSFALGTSPIYAMGKAPAHVSCGDSRTISRTGFDVQIGSGGGCGPLQHNQPDVARRMIANAQSNGEMNVLERLKDFDKECADSVQATTSVIEGPVFENPEFGSPVINPTDNCNVTVKTTLTKRCNCS